MRSNLLPNNTADRIAFCVVIGQKSENTSLLWQTAFATEILLFPFPFFLFIFQTVVPQNNIFLL